jgi:hypothetical protein
MFAIAIVSRRLKEGKTYEDFRKAWFHTTGFATSSKLYTVINAFDPREIIVIGFTETNIDDFQKTLEIDIKERLENPLDAIIETENTSSKFGLLVSEDDFSATGKIDYKPAAVGGHEMDLNQFSNDLHKIADMIQSAIKKRDALKKSKSAK